MRARVVRAVIGTRIRRDGWRARSIAAAVCMVLCAIPTLHAQQLTGTVREAGGSSPIPYCTVIDTLSRAGCACDGDGRFTLPASSAERVLRFSAIGYEPLLVPLAPGATTVHARLRPAVIRLSDEVVIEGARGSTLDAVDHRRSASLDDALRDADGVTLTRRANFAAEASVRGATGDRLTVVIDGMKVHGACSDRMDPVTAYVDVENLARLDVAKGGHELTLGRPGGGTLGLITRTPEFGEGVFTEVEAGWESAAAQQRLRVGAGGDVASDAALGDVAVLGTVSLRRAGDFRSGGGERITGSGFEKLNYKGDIAWRPGETQRLILSFIGDDAWDVGFPALIMDTRRTSAQIWSLRHQWTRPAEWMTRLSTTLAFNRIDHWMDDNDRDVRARTVMPDMRMPMYGRTRTAGLRSELGYASDAHAGVVVAELSRMDAFADMWMHPVDPAARSAYLVNLGDVTVSDASLAVSHGLSAGAGVLLRVSLRGDVSVRDVADPASRKTLHAFWPGAALARTIAGGGAGAAVEWRSSNLVTLTAAMSAGSRIPSHLESYGYYSYSYVDGAFVIGNPGLRPETAVQAELTAAAEWEGASARATVHGSRIRDYITGVAYQNDVRLMRNLSSATIVGVEARTRATVATHGDVRIAVAWTRGDNNETGEPLPLIAPFGGSLGLGWTVTEAWGGQDAWFGIDLRGALPQRRAATRTTLEDETPGWLDLSVRTRIGLGAGLRLTAGVDNLLDRHYHDHLSLGNLPAPGRNVHLALSWVLRDAAPSRSWE